MRTNLTNFENGEPLFSLDDVKSLTDFTANIVIKAVKDNLRPAEYEPYIRRWCDTNCMPDEIFVHICTIVAVHLNSIRNNG